MADRSVRSLEHLETSASTSRVLNLRAIARLKGQDPDYRSRPFFQSPQLNASIILKHRLRGDEGDQFPMPRRVATKILVPIETSDLRLGARYVFVGQRGFKQALFEAFGFAAGENSADLKTLEVLDRTPTLDPFLLREQLKRQDLTPARCYFDLSIADTRRMFGFAQREIEPLVRMSLGNSAAADIPTEKLTRKILSNSGDAELEPLRRTLQLDAQQFEEGAFCWKAFLYYKWQLSDLLPRVNPVLLQVESIRPRGPLTDEARAYLAAARTGLRDKLLGACKSVMTTLEVYDTAYKGLIHHSDPGGFRAFLLNAPLLFDELGERLGGIEHMVSFWRFRFPGDKMPVVTPEELCDIFMDFEGGLNVEAATPMPMLAAGGG